MKLILDNGQEIILSQETSEVIMQEIEKNTKPIRNFNHKIGVTSYSVGIFGNVAFGDSIKDETDNLNSFTNEEYAKKIARRQYIDKLILNFIDENRVDEIKQNDTKTEKYELYYNSFYKDLGISNLFSSKSSLWVFPTKELAQQCIDKYKDELIEFFTMEV